MLIRKKDRAHPGLGLENRKATVPALPGGTGRSWSGTAKLLHWVMAALIFTQFALGWLAVGWRLSPTKLDLFVWHKSIGLTILVLVTLRLGWRVLDRGPPWPATMPPWERMAAGASHALLYAFMIALPLTGWIINSAARIPLRAFWLVPISYIVPADKATEEFTKQVHFVLFLGLAIVLTVHIAAALRHHFVRRDNVLRQMLPGLKTQS